MLATCSFPAAPGWLRRGESETWVRSRVHCSSVSRGPQCGRELRGANQERPPEPLLLPCPWSCVRADNPGPGDLSLGAAGLGRRCTELTWHRSASDLPTAVPSLLAQTDDPVRRGSGLLHHPNCRVVCVHQGNSRDSKLNSNMQFIQDERPIERLCRRPRPPFWRQKFPAARAATAHACLLGPRLPGMRILPGSQLPSHFTDGVAEAQRRVSHVEIALGTRRPAPAWGSSVFGNCCA